MKWERKTSKKFEDRRGMSGGSKAIVGGGIIGIVVLLLTMFGGETGQVIGTVLQQTQTVTDSSEPVKTRDLSQEEITLGHFSEAVFVYNNETWDKIFRSSGQTYQEPGMVLFDDGVQTACGTASSAVGPFYCPADQTVYMDLRFFEELHSRFGAKRGDFAIAYVIAHEVGHHVQTIVGTSQQIRSAQQGQNKAAANKLSVAQELQADFYAGIWASHHKDILEERDIEIAISAAEAVGDDAIQSRVQGHVQPETFTHGTSAERKYWFMKGYNTGNISQGDIQTILNSIQY